MNPIGRFFIVGCPFYIGFSVFLLDRQCGVAMLTPTRGANRGLLLSGQPPQPARKADQPSGLTGCHLSVWNSSLALGVARLPWLLWLQDHGRGSGKTGRRHNPRFFCTRQHAANWHEHCINGGGRIEKKKLTRALNP
jgi:hypothetical protein